MASSSIKSSGRFDANAVAAVLFAFPVAVLVTAAVVLSRFAHLLHRETSRRIAPLPMEEQRTGRLFRNCAIPPSYPAPHSWQYQDRQEETVKLPPQAEPTTASFPLAIPVPVAVPVEPLVLAFGTFGEFLSQELVPNAPAPVQVSEEEPATAPESPETEEEPSESMPATPVKVKTPRTRTRRVKVAVAALPPSVDESPAPLAPVDESESTPSEAPSGPQEPPAGDDLDDMNRDDLRALRARLDIKVKGASKLGSGALRVLIRQHRATS